MTEMPTPSQQQAADTSLGDLVGEVSRDLSELMRKELELAKAELSESAKRAGKGAGLMGGAGYAGGTTAGLGGTAAGAGTLGATGYEGETPIGDALSGDALTGDPLAAGAGTDATGAAQDEWSATGEARR